MRTITEAKIYEQQGLKDEALEIYKNILLKDKNNQAAKDAILRLSGAKIRSLELNNYMYDFFVNMQSEQEENEFKRWLINI
ncbi:hypothetical protein AVCANL279_08625 [Campylobacter canadensis]|uniref:Tetratricopeptide repeat protein n=2 Tax=Campylobacter canadensis TaxID=449520 RepID=A0ABS7WSK6_9BACT|nr:hypothetical protein [Campylobacter canadensis]MBZ7994144.1 hypothetical protein [Campylobacter canadensis]MBZ7997373.1 hypothetical protein [Campylobacter canadensis]MBZ7999062.1 hypothetical protein [Campylobacter canadensis]MBZ7999475.1 hypothetical protein [Campylobacter canadensis]